MGNNLCCEQTPKKQFDHTITVIHKQQPIRLPELNPTIVSHLDRQRPFFNELSMLGQPTVKIFGHDIYQGRVDERGRPNGFGKMYHRNGEVFLGEFVAGVANGQGHYVRNDGSYYHGRMRGNMANDQNGYYWSPKFEYRGGIVDNQIHGKGRENGENHSFEGVYEGGRKVSGIFRWRDGQNQYQYDGNFNNEGNFEGKGKLQQKGKGTYVGDFSNGNKHGKGQFNFDSGLTYIGQYYHNVKEGLGKIVNRAGHVAYEGQFKSGMPHGRGKAPNQQGQMKQRYWIDGIDKTMLQQ